MQKIRFWNETEFDLISAVIKKETLKNFYREIVELTISNMSYNQALTYFEDGVTWTIIDETGETYEWADYGVSGPITDNRDDTITVKMGKNNTVEQDLEEKVNIANESIIVLAGKTISSSTEAQEIRNQIESVYESATVEMDADEKIINRNLAPVWKSGVHVVGEVFCTHAGDGLGSEWEQLWEVYQQYDNSVYPDIVPGNSSWYTFNKPYHGTTPETALPFVPVQGSHDMYKVGEYMIYTDGYLYKCKQQTNFSPDDYAAAWDKLEKVE